MPRRWLVRALLVAAACAALRTVTISAHDAQTDAPIAAYLEAGADRIELLLRVPLETLALSLPTRAGQIDPDAAAPFLDHALARIASAITVFEGASPLAPATRDRRLSLPSDRSFDNYEAASAHLHAAGVDTPVYANQGYFDIRLTYARGFSPSSVAVQSRFSEEWGVAPKLSLRFLDSEQRERRYFIEEGFGRVALDATMSEAARRFFTIGMTWILENADHLLLLTCLLLPLRALREIMAVIAALIAGYAAVTVAAFSDLARVDQPLTQVAEAAIAVVVTAAAVFNVVTPSFPRRWVTALIGSTIGGLVFAGALQDKLALAGSHPAVAALALNVGMATAAVLVATTLVGLSFLFVHRSTNAWLRTLIVSAIVADLAWHWSAERVGPLWQAGWVYSGPSLLMVGRWIAAVLLLVNVGLYLARALRPPTVFGRNNGASGGKTSRQESTRFTTS